MKRFFLSLTAVSLGLCLCSCEYCNWGYWEAKANKEKLNSLRIGMSKQDVIAVMGEPLRDEIYNKPDTWFYYTDLKWSDGVIAREECTVVCFNNGKLVGWGADYYKDKVLFPDPNLEDNSNSLLSTSGFKDEIMQAIGRKTEKTSSGSDDSAQPKKSVEAILKQAEEVTAKKNELSPAASEMEKRIKQDIKSDLKTPETPAPVKEKPLPSINTPVVKPEEKEAEPSSVDDVLRAAEREAAAAKEMEKQQAAESIQAPSVTTDKDKTQPQK